MSVGTTAVARRATRALAVITVLLGVLAMHGLASTHHAVATTTAAQHGAAQHRAPAVASDQPAAPDVQHDGDVLSAPDGPRCDDDCLDLAMLCVAVLTGAALLALLLARRRPARRLPPTARHDATTTTTRAPSVRHARGPDPVEELCVSRT